MGHYDDNVWFEEQKRIRDQENRGLVRVPRWLKPWYFNTASIGICGEYWDTQENIDKLANEILDGLASSRF